MMGNPNDPSYWIDLRKRAAERPGITPQELEQVNALVFKNLTRLQTVEPQGPPSSAYGESIRPRYKETGGVEPSNFGAPVQPMAPPKPASIGDVVNVAERNARLTPKTGLERMSEEPAAVLGFQKHGGGEVPPMEKRPYSGPAAPVLPWDDTPPNPGAGKGLLPVPEPSLMSELGDQAAAALVSAEGVAAHGLPEKAMDVATGSAPGTFEEARQAVAERGSMPARVAGGLVGVAVDPLARGSAKAGDRLAGPMKGAGRAKRAAVVGGGTGAAYAAGDSALRGQGPGEVADSIVAEGGVGAVMGPALEYLPDMGGFLSAYFNSPKRAWASTLEPYKSAKAEGFYKSPRHLEVREKPDAVYQIADDQAQRIEAKHQGIIEPARAQRAQAMEQAMSSEPSEALAPTMLPDQTMLAPRLRKPAPQEVGMSPVDAMKKTQEVTRARHEAAAEKFKDGLAQLQQSTAPVDLDSLLVALAKPVSAGRSSAMKLTPQAESLSNAVSGVREFLGTSPTPNDLRLALDFVKQKAQWGELATPENIGFRNLDKELRNALANIPGLEKLRESAAEYARMADANQSTNDLVFRKFADNADVGASLESTGTNFFKRATKADDELAADQFSRFRKIDPENEAIAAAVEARAKAVADAERMATAQSKGREAIANPEAQLPPEVVAEFPATATAQSRYESTVAPVREANSILRNRKTTDPMSETMSPDMLARQTRTTLKHFGDQSQAGWARSPDAKKLASIDPEYADAVKKVEQEAAYSRTRLKPHRTAVSQDIATTVAKGAMSTPVRWMVPSTDAVVARIAEPLSTSMSKAQLGKVLDGIAQEFGMTTAQLLAIAADNGIRDPRLVSASPPPVADAASFMSLAARR